MINRDHYGRERAKSALLHLLTGRVVSGLLGFLNLILVLRLLPANEFGLYASLLSFQVIFIAWSSFGLEAATERYLPEIRVTKGTEALLGFLFGMLLLRLLSLVFAVGLVWVLSERLLGLVGLEQLASLLADYIWAVLAMALMNLGGAALEALLFQKAAQTAAVLYALIRLSLILYASAGGVLAVRDLVWIDLLAALAASGFCVFAVVVQLRSRTIEKRDFVLKSLAARVRSFAAKNYLAQMLMQAYGPHAMRLAVTSLATLSETARMGFAMSLSDLAQRYLPAVLLMRMIRPLLVTKYLDGKDFEKLNTFANIVLKLNVLMISPVIGVFAVIGGDISHVISAGKYGDSVWLVVGFMVLLLMTSHQLVVSIVANTLEANDLQVKAAMSAIGAIAVGWALIPLWGAYGALAAAACSAIIYNAVATALLRRKGYPYRVHMPGIAILLCGAAPAAAGSYLCSLVFPMDIAGLAIAAIAGILSFICFAAVFKGFSAAERQIIHGIVPKKYFPF